MTDKMSADEVLAVLRDAAHAVDPLVYIGQKLQPNRKLGSRLDTARATVAALIAERDAQAARIAELEAVASAVMRWWEDHQFDSVYLGEDGERNVYDEDPEMVVLAKAARGGVPP